MTDEIEIKVKRKASKKISKKSVNEVLKKVAPKKKITKAAAKKKDEKKEDPKKENSKLNAAEELEKNLDLMDSEGLDDESKRALIRARTAQAEKQNRLNLIADGQLVHRKEVIETIKTIVFGAVEILDLFPDQVGPLVYKKTQKQIREKMISNVDKVKQKFINLLLDFDDE